MNHGGGGDDSNWPSEDPKRGGRRAAYPGQSRIAAGKAKRMVIVMPNTSTCASAKPSAPGKDDACTQEYLKDIIPYVDSHYSTKATRENRALAGLSMGGFVVLHTGLPHLDTFSELYVYSSGHINADDLEAVRRELCTSAQSDPKTSDLFLRAVLYGGRRNRYCFEQRPEGACAIQCVWHSQLLGLEHRRA